MIPLRPICTTVNLDYPYSERVPQWPIYILLGWGDLDSVACRQQCAPSSSVYVHLNSLIPYRYLASFTFTCSIEPLDFLLPFSAGSSDVNSFSFNFDTWKQAVWRELQFCRRRLCLGSLIRCPALRHSLSLQFPSINTPVLFTTCHRCKLVVLYTIGQASSTVHIRQANSTARIRQANSTVHTGQSGSTVHLLSWLWPIVVTWRYATGLGWPSATPPLFPCAVPCTDVIYAFLGEKKSHSCKLSLSCWVWVEQTEFEQTELSLSLSLSLSWVWANWVWVAFLTKEIGPKRWYLNKFHSLLTLLYYQETDGQVVPAERHMMCSFCQRDTIYKFL